MYIKGYLFETLEAANDAVSVINSGEGLPNSGFSTQTYCNPIEVVGGWAILKDEVTSHYLSGEVDIEYLPIN